MANSMEIDGVHINLESPIVHNVFLDADKAGRELDSMLVVDASSELDILEESPFVAVTCFCMRWLQKAMNMRIKNDDKLGALKEVVVAAIESDNNDKPLLDFTEQYEDITTLARHNMGETTIVETRRRVRTKIRKGYRSLFAARLACEAKLKFGNMSYNEANIMMVRRWLSKMLDVPEYKDLRITDKLLALDRAVFMAFVVSEDFKRYKVLFENKLMNDRILLRFGASE